MMKWFVGFFLDSNEDGTYRIDHLERVSSRGNTKWQRPSACDDIHDDNFTLEDDIQSEDISQDMQTQYTTRSGRKTKRVLNEEIVEECQGVYPTKEDGKSKKRLTFYNVIGIVPPRGCI